MAVRDVVEHREAVHKDVKYRAAFAAQEQVEYLRHQQKEATPAVDPKLRDAFAVHSWTCSSSHMVFT